MMEKHVVGENGISYTLGADESRSRDYGRIKGKQPDEVGWIDEQCKKCSGRDSSKRTDICVK